MRQATSAHRLRRAAFQLTYKFTAAISAATNRIFRKSKSFAPSTNHKITVATNAATNETNTFFEVRVSRHQASSVGDDKELREDLLWSFAWSTAASSTTRRGYLTVKP